jgi:hypothetical protein
MDIIPIQASSVACERVFSSGKQTMTPRRSRISALLMEALQILKFAIRKDTKDSSLKFTDMTWKEELMEFERLARSAPPGDAEAYGRHLEDDKGDSDDISDRNEEDINSEVIGEQITPELKDNEDDEDIYV